ncbi:hypothetical protein [Nostoc sp.]|uniref:hypothetical protein n=1 Tax=Nostoc sp. TaxID=1180 RepID=UPI002FF8EBBF
MTQRLNRIEAILERTAQRAEANRVAMSSDKPLLYERLLRLRSAQVRQRVYAQLGLTVNSLVQVVEIHQLNHEATQGNFEGIVTELREIRSEIRGLRTESQRILEHLFGRQENGE